VHIYACSMAEEDRARGTIVKTCFWVLCKHYQGVEAFVSCQIGVAQ